TIATAITSKSTSTSTALTTTLTPAALLTSTATPALLETNDYKPLFTDIFTYNDKIIPQMKELSINLCRVDNLKYSILNCGINLRSLIKLELNYVEKGEDILVPLINIIGPQLQTLIFETQRINKHVLESLFK